MKVSIAAFLTILSLAYGSKVPVLLWSPSRSMIDLPQSYAGKTIKTSEFTNSYLSPLTSKSSDHHLVVFVQDKLSLEDFTNYADVYNPESDGGAFKNVKGFMDDQFSVHLSSVHSPDVAVDNLIQDFKGKVHNVNSLKDLSGLDLGSGQSLIIVTLSPIKDAENEEKALATNDQMIGEVVQHLNKRSVKYSAIYTGQESSKLDVGTTSVKRRLLSTDVKANGTFINETCLYFFTRGVTVLLVQNNTNVTLSSNETGYISGDNSMCTNDTATLNLQMTYMIDGDDFNVTLEIQVVKNLNFSANEWKIDQATLNVEGVYNTTQFTGPEDMTRAFRDIWAPLDFSYHCANLTFKSKPTNRTDGYNATVLYHKFQFQPFNIKDNQFSDGWDCVEFFTPGIWMAIVSVGLLSIILFYGMTMLADLKTQDRFDDPKGKPMVVNVVE